ncbi:MAG: class I SAM-dependent methyltransferase [Melioribacteraceae bacterium]|nr:class I SAM-dependent methyltransferase [Melioribacteraceae bacterium]
MLKTKLDLNVKQGEIQNAEFPNKFFDYIHINNVLEHVRDPKGFLSECRRIIKNDGYLFLSVPNGYNDSRNLIKFYEEENKPARSKSGHLYFFQKETFYKLFETTGFKILKSKTNGIKRGLRNLEILPKKKNWKTDYYPQQPSKKSNIKIDEEKKYSDFYYKFRYMQTRLYDIPGLHKFGLDYLFLLRPSNKK